MAREIRTVQNYQDRLLKLIPSEIVGAYMVLQGIIPEDSAKWGTLVVAGVLFILTPFYLQRIQQVNRGLQLLVTTVSFAVWVYSLGGPFIYWGLHKAWIASVILVLWTIIVPVVVNPKEEVQPA